MRTMPLVLLCGCTVQTAESIFETITRQEAWEGFSNTEPVGETGVPTDDTGSSGGDDSGDIPPSSGDCLALTGPPDRLVSTDEALLPMGSASRTVEVRVRKESNTGGEQYIVSWGTPSRDQAFMLGMWDGQPLLTQNGDAIAASTTVSAGTFHHLAVTFDGSTVRLFLDGQLNSSKAMTVDTQPGGELVIGNSVSGDGSKNFVGLIDEVRIWGEVLPDGALADRMATPLSGDESGLIGWWTLEGTGTGSGFSLESGAAAGGLTLTAEGDADSPYMTDCP